MKIYLAAASKEMARVRAGLEVLRSNPDLTVISDWHNADVLGRDATLPQQDRRAIAERCRYQIFRSDAVWLLYSPFRSVGSSYELGFADAYRRTVVISGPNCGDSIFTEDRERASRCFEHDADAYRELVRLSCAQTAPMAVVGMAVGS